MNPIHGTLYLFICRLTVSVWLWEREEGERRREGREEEEREEGEGGEGGGGRGGEREEINRERKGSEIGKRNTLCQTLSTV